MHEDTCEIQLYLETHVNIGPVDCGRPPESESSVGNLVKTRSLSVCELLVFHRLFEARRLLPEETFPSREICTLEKCVLKDAFNTTQCLDHVCAIVVKVPQLAIVLLMRPPEGILLEYLILLEILSDSPALVISECQTILLEEGINSGDASVPRVLQVIKSQSSILSSCLLSLECIFSPHTLRIQEFRLP